MARYESILDVVGNTPLVGVHALSPNPAVRIYALRMVEAAEREG